MQKKKKGRPKLWLLYEKPDFQKGKIVGRCFCLQDDGRRVLMSKCVGKFLSQKACLRAKDQRDLFNGVLPKEPREKKE